MGKEPTPPIAAFLRSATVTPIIVNEVQQERLINIENFKHRIAEFHPIVENIVRANRERA